MTHSDILKRLNDYRSTIRTAAYWEDHGRRGDGKLEAAREEESKARALLLQVIREATQSNH